MYGDEERTGGGEHVNGSDICIGYGCEKDVMGVNVDSYGHASGERMDVECDRKWVC